MKSKEKKFTITLKWHIGRKIENIKFNLETKLERKLTWDEFFNKVEIKVNDTERERDG